MAQLRKYEVNKMKYYYAVVHCNSKKCANRIMEENNGMELELTNIKLNMSCVADDLKFPQEAKEVATEVPPNYAFNGASISRALNHSTVRLSWDQNDKKRENMLANNFKKLLKRKEDEMGDADEFEAYKDFIAGSSDESVSDDAAEGSEAEEKEQARIESMRAKLLGGLTDDKPGKGKRNDDDSVDYDAINSDVGEELEVNWGVGFGEDIGKKLIREKEEKAERRNMSEFQKWQQKK